MSDDNELAMLLGTAPAAPDPGFRVAALAQITARGARRAARTRALRLALGSLAIGLIFAAAQAAGFSWELAQPLALAVSTLAAAALFAFLAIGGQRSALALLQAPHARA